MRRIDDNARAAFGEVAGKEAVVAIGVFDGVHLGHQALLRQAAEIGRRHGLPLVAVTFHPHPRTLTSETNGYDHLLTPPAEKAALIEECGADHLVTLRFTRELASTSPREFVASYLVREVQSRYVVCGFNFTFGYRGAGTPRDLEEWGAELGFVTHVMPPYLAGGEIVSSTRVRSCLTDGDVTQASECLGRPYCLWGRVSSGDGRGRRIGVPTSNLAVPEDKLMPAPGVYAGWARFLRGGGGLGGKDASESPCVVNVGTRPTFDGSDLRVEVHLPGFAGELYGRPMQVFLFHRLRDERKFPDVSALKAQIDRDISETLALFANGPSFTLPGAYGRMLASELP